ncbi:MAG: hypothetical protein EPN57_18320 [Paraburkholderia sp.]|nr:MAG: hypothetical protein EPN57_18320 [Paraburkholderia sp.]
MLRRNGNDARSNVVELEGAGPWLVLWQDGIKRDQTDWGRLEGHACNGFSCDTLDGYVLELKPTKGREILSAIANEHFCSSCKYDSLDYGATVEHEKAYADWLLDLGITAGDVNQLKQAVYPLAATAETLARFGVEGVQVPAEAHLFVLGENCD